MGEKSELISQELEAQLQTLFQKLENKVVLKCVLDEAQKESSEMKRMVSHMADLSDLVEVQIVDKQEVVTKDVAHLPLTMIYKEDTDTGISFHGVPGGQEMNSFVVAVLMAGGAKKLEAKDGRVEGKHSIDILVSLSCHHCAKQVMNCFQIAYLSEQVEAAMYDARLYPDLVEKYKIERIPMTIIDGETTIMGVKEIEELIAIL